MSETVLIPGGRDVRASLDLAASDDGGSDAVAGAGSDAVVVACPPHPRQGGHRGDERLVAASDALAARGIDCLRFDYGEWDEGYGETTDADAAVGWAAERYDRVGLFGFSFGGTVALVTAAARPELAGVCALAPTARLNPDADAVAA
ncbi:alpha/beta hydrolase, partial [Halorubrum sp. CBA1125]|uniref:CocE/NonD family hydrolase n=1 Tax=Halorubrum sp. CBA1125 TaxID=2668072 RepID=UPI00135D70AA